MSGVTLHLYSEWDRLRIDCDDDEPVIWVRGEKATVSLKLSAGDRDKLRAALDQADAMDAKNGGLP